MTTERKRTIQYAVMAFALGAVVVIVVMMLTGCKSVPQTRQAWVQATTPAGEPLVDAASGSPILAPMVDGDGQPVYTPVVEDGVVKMVKVIDMQTAQEITGIVATTFPPSAPFAGLALGLLALFGRKQQ